MASVALLALMGASCEDASGGPSLAGVVASASGFDVRTDGASFENFAGYTRTAIFDRDSARRLFGDAVCLNIKDGYCTLSPEAELWIGEANASTQGGLCEGFAALAHLSWAGRVDLSHFGAPALGRIDRQTHTEVDKELAYWFSTQHSKRVKDATRKMGARELAGVLSLAFAKGKQGETYRLGILRLQGGELAGGHALSPYAIASDGADRWKVAVYDSNHPGADRALVLDLAKDTWSYVASTNPEEPEGLYEGGPGARNPVYLTPNSVRLGVQPCHFCGQAGSGQTVSFGGALRVETEDSKGNRAGVGVSGLYSDIPGMTVLPTYGQGNFYRDPPSYTFSSDAESPITIRATSTNRSSAPGDDISISTFGPGGSAAVRGQGLGGSHTLNVAGTGVATYRTDTQNVGPLSVTARTANGGSVAVSLAVRPSGGGGVDMGVSLDPSSGEVKLTVGGAGNATVQVTVKTQDGQGNANEVTLPIADMPPGTATLDSNEVRTGGAVTVTITEGSDAGPPRTQTVASCPADKCPPLGGRDGDIVPDKEDNCPSTYNPDQGDLDKDGIGDACDADKDGDGVSGDVDCDDRDPSVRSCACSPGSWDDDRNPATACVACSAGAHCPGGNAARRACAAGTVDDDGNPATPCRPCLAGEYCTGGVTAPTRCAAGTQDEDRNPGTPCSACAAGTYCPGGDAIASSCPPGTEDEDGNPVTSCRPCSVGEYCAGGLARAEVCPALAWDDDSNPATPCAPWKACRPGEYAASAGSAGKDRDCSPCAEGTFSTLSNAPTCEPWTRCLAGAYVASPGTASSDQGCLPCASGTYAASVDAPSCLSWTMCSAGQLVVKAGSATNDTACASCPTGTFSTGANAMACQAWTECPQGTFVLAAPSGAVDRTCAACPSGTYTSGPNQSACIPNGECPPGTTQTAPPTASSPAVCESCSVGEHCPGGTAARVSCGAENWDDDADPRTDCVPWAVCGPGEYVAASGGASRDRGCMPCAAGSYSAGSNATACVDWTACAPGSRISSQGTRTADQSCQACPSGSYSTTWNTPTCSPWSTCAAGTFVSNAPSTSADRSCQACASGTYSSGVNQSSCVASSACPAGTVETVAGTASSPPTCAACTAGQYCAGGASSPNACAAGTQDADADPATACTACSAGQHCPGGATLAASCAAGTQDADADPATACTACSAGTYCPGGATLAASCMAGTQDIGGNPATACTACSAGTYCPGGATLAASCAAGTQDADADPATACTACSAGQYCPGGATLAASCAAGTQDADADPATACTACSVGTYCAGGARLAITCTAEIPDDDSDSATPCFGVLHTFNGADGSQPNHGALVLYNSTFYGTTYAGAGNNIYKIGQDGQNFTVLRTLSGTDGINPWATPRLSGTTLYAMTEAGGTLGGGTLFKIDIDGTQFSVLQSFTTTTGYASRGGLTLSGGTLYGSTYLGGTNGGGTIFKIGTDGTGFTTLVDFTDNGAGGYNPVREPTISGSTLYGTTRNGGANAYGAVYKMGTDGIGFTILHSFTGSGTGRSPMGRLTLSGSTLYGITLDGGASDMGTLYKVNTDGSGFAVLHTFTGGTSDGEGPIEGVLVSDTTLYGMTRLGGASGWGTIYKISTTGTGFTIVRSFTGAPTGGSYARSLFLQVGDMLYATTANGGANNDGMIFGIALP